MTTTDRFLLDAWYAIARVADVRYETMMPIRLLGEHLVLWASERRGITVLADRCPHRSVRLSAGEVRDGNIVCPYHGWQFDSNGQCTHIPAHPAMRIPSSFRVHSYPVRERFGVVWTTLGDPDTEIHDFPEWHDGHYTHIPFGPYAFHASPFRVVENAFDIPHFAILHDKQLGLSARPEIPRFQVSVGKDGLRIRNVRIWQPDIDGSGSSGQVRYDHYLPHPLTLYTEKSFSGGCQTAYFTITPVAESEAIAWGWSAFRGAVTANPSDFNDYQKLLYESDKSIVESQYPADLPISRSRSNAHDAEVHVESDRGSTAYRRWLRELGATYAVC